MTLQLTRLSLAFLLPRALHMEVVLAYICVAAEQVLLANEQLDEDVSLTRLAEKTSTFSGSDLRALCTAAAMRPVRELLEASGKSAKVMYLLSGSKLLDSRS